LFSHHHLENGTYKHVKDGICSFIYAFVNNIFIKPFYTVTLKIQISRKTSHCDDTVYKVKLGFCQTTTASQEARQVRVKGELLKF
jgi:hypothetical protein